MALTPPPATPVPAAPAAPGDAPSRANPTSFRTLADAFVVWLVGFRTSIAGLRTWLADYMPWAATHVTELNALQADVTAKQAATAAASVVAVDNAAAASASASSAAASRGAIDNRIYPGTYAIAPATRPDGSAIQDGDVYSSGTSGMFSRIGGAWVLQTAASTVDMANTSDPAKGSSLLGHRSATVRAALDYLTRRDRTYLNQLRRAENTMDAFMSPGTVDIPTITYNQTTMSATDASTSLAGITRDVESVTRADVGGVRTVTVTTKYPHNFEVGKIIVMQGADQADYNGGKTVTLTGERTFTYTISNTAFPATPATGTITCYQRAHFHRAPEAVFTYNRPRATAVSGVAGAAASWLIGYAEIQFGQSPWAVEFICTDDTFEFVTRRTTGGIRMLVDGYQVASVRPLPVDVSFPTIHTNVAFSLARPRIIRLEFDGAAFIGAFTRQKRHLKKYEAPPKPTCLFLADSFGEGTGSFNGRFGSVCAYVGYKMGWEMVNGSLGSTGITTVGVQGAGNDYIGRLRALYARHKPDIVFVMGSVNDGGNITTANAGALFDAIADVCPNARIIAFGPTWPTEAPPASSITSATNLRAAAQARGIIYLDGGIGLDGNALWLSGANKQAYYTGTTATATATLTADAVTAIAVTNPGEGYSFHAGAPAVSFTGGGGGAGAAATANMNYRVKDIVVLNGGSGYTAPPAVTIGGGAAAICTLAGNTVQGITVTSEGGGYIVPPTVTVNSTNGAGGGATAVAVIEGGRVVRIDLTNAGAGYTATPSISISECTTQATATANIVNGKVVSVTITDPGSFYKSTPRVSFSGGGTGAGGAEAVAFLAGVVDTITVTNGGAGYTVAPGVTLPNPTNGDVTHPKEAGHQMLAARICAQLRELRLS